MASIKDTRATHRTQIQRSYDVGTRSFYSFFCLDQRKLAYRFNQLENWELKHYCYQLLPVIYNAEIRMENLYGTLTYELVIITRNVLWFCDERFMEELDAVYKNLKIRRIAILNDFNFRTDLLPRDVKRHQQLLIPNYSKAAGMLLLSEEEVRGLLQEIRQNDVYQGSVRALVADILKKARAPLHIDVIMEKFFGPILTQIRKVSYRA